MFSKKDLMERPEELQPLGSFKGVNNQPSFPFIDLDLYELFNSDGNRLFLADNLYKIHQQNGGRSTTEKITLLVPKLMAEFCRNKNVRGYDVAETNATSQKNWSAILKAINHDFIKHCYKHFKWNNFNPFREYILVGENGKRRYKKFQDLMPDDYGTLDLWREQFIQINNNQFRDNNAIPTYRTGIQTRNYDTGNEGLREGDRDRASLENYQRRFDMSTIVQAIDNYRDRDWFGM
jgi:hypothetical protein